MPALSPAAIEAGLSSVLARLSAHGEVAHEEDIGERAVLDHLSADGTRSAAPVFDYKMIDADYLLAPVAGAWLHDERARARTEAFLAAPAGGPGERSGTRGAALVDNLRFVLTSASGFAADPRVAHLIALKPGFSVGDWRDSDTGPSVEAGIRMTSTRCWCRRRSAPRSCTTRCTRALPERF
jgi:hypothetical protein